MDEQSSALAHTRRDERLTIVEERVGALDAAVKGLSNDIRALTTAVAAREKPQWGLYLGAFGIATTLAAGFWGIAIAPGEMRDNAHQDQIRALERDMHSHLILPVHPVAAETLSHQQRLIQMLWRKAYGEDMPGVNIPNRD